MILSYTLRLFCLCFASFFLVHAAASLAAWIFAPSMIRIGESMRPRFAARLLLGVRLLPFALGAFAVAAFCAPSYLWLEPEADAERVGIACCVAAFLGAAIWGVSLARVVRAMFIGTRYRRQCGRKKCAARISSGEVPVFVVDSETPILALAGVIRPRIMVSRAVLEALSRDQLDAALSHERAHESSRDNFKRLLMVFARSVFPFTRGFAALDRAWARVTEWAADDRATQGDSRRSLSLAEALVRVARMGAPGPASLFLSSLIGDGVDLSVRVNRLLGCEPPAGNPRRGVRAFLGSIAVATAALLLCAMARPQTFHAVHRLLEQLIR